MCLLPRKTFSALAFSQNGKYLVTGEVSALRGFMRAKRMTTAKCPSPPHLKRKGGSLSLIHMVMYICGRGVMTGLLGHLCSAFDAFQLPGCHGEAQCLSQQRTVVATADHKCSAMPAFLYLGILTN